MHKLILNIEESKYQLLLQFLKTLDYVSISNSVDDTSSGAVEQKSEEGEAPQHEKNAPGQNQLALLQQRLNNIQKPLFQTITDPVEWQKKQRDEWS